VDAREHIVKAEDFRVPSDCIQPRLFGGSPIAWLLLETTVKERHRAFPRLLGGVGLVLRVARVRQEPVLRAFVEEAFDRRALRPQLLLLWYGAGTRPELGADPALRAKRFPASPC
jgi:hypothetical protein